MPPLNRLPGLGAGEFGCGASRQGFSQGLPGPHAVCRVAVVLASLCPAAGCDCDQVTSVRFLTSSAADPLPLPITILMAFSLGNFLARWSRWAIAFCVAWCVLCSCALLAGWGGEDVARFIGSWASVPLLVAVLLFLWPVATDQSLPLLRRRAFQLFFAAEAIDLVASVGWNYTALYENVTYGSWPDVIWQIYYPLATAACMYLYFSLGGRLDTLRSQLDFATVSIGFGALLWFTALEPLTEMNARQV